MVPGAGARHRTGLAQAVGVALRAAACRVNDGMRTASANLWCAGDQPPGRCARRLAGTPGFWFTLGWRTPKYGNPLCRRRPVAFIDGRLSRGVRYIRHKPRG